jgi:hypothetical protein
LSVVVREARLGALGRRFPRLLRENENFRRYFVGQSVSLLGDQV